MGVCTGRFNNGVRYCRNRWIRPDCRGVIVEKIYKFKVNVIESGQRRKYGDSYYTYTVTNECEQNYDASVIERFCKGFLRRPVRFIDSPCHFDSTETFEKLGDREYKYCQVVPSTH